MSDTHTDEVKKHVKIYVNVFLALMVLTVITVAVSYLDLPIPVAIVLALIVATIKSSLVAGFFMHLIHEKKVKWWIFLQPKRNLLLIYIL